jgi:predicted HNH restriction endonuclease
MDSKIFYKAAFTIFDKVLMDYGFKVGRKKISKFSIDKVYTNGDRYVRLFVEVDSSSYPPPLNIILGQGSIEWPDCDWNAIGFWRLKKELMTAEIEEKDEISTSDLNKLAIELITYAEGFLKGDLTLFYKLRKEQNINREPYKVSRQTEDGGQELTIDEKSIQLKEKYG